MLLLPGPCYFLRLRLASPSHSLFCSQWLRVGDGRSCSQQIWGAQRDPWEAQTGSLTFIWEKGKERWIWGRGGTWLSRDDWVSTRRPVRCGRMRKVHRGRSSTRSVIYKVMHLKMGWTEQGISIVVEGIHWLCKTTPQAVLSSSASAAAHHEPHHGDVLHIFYCLLYF